MNDVLNILTGRELFLVILASSIYIVLFVVTVQNSRRKILSLEQRLAKARAMQEHYDIKQGERRVAELESLIKKLGDENSMLRLELEEKKLSLDYNNKVALLEREKRERAESALLSSGIYGRLQECLRQGRSLGFQDWAELTALLDSTYSGLTQKLFSLYPMSQHELHVSLLIKVRLQPKDIATLTAHSKESIATTRSRLFWKVFGRKGSSKDWDDFILNL